ncbi:hypothetical protein QP38_0121 [Levilactobacillus brevis]|nr:hypothetical protein QP38_0121 [Levilactobacillus brevis]
MPDFILVSDLFAQLTATPLISYRQLTSKKALNSTNCI